jgi:hypothetical protein
MPPAGTRPTGVTILAILAAIGGILLVLAGLGATVLGGAVIGSVGGAAGTGIGGLVLIFGLFALALGVLYLAFAYGAWGLKPWAWTLGIAGQILSLVLSVLRIVTGNASITSEIIGIAIALIILYYLDTPDVRRAFGRNPTSWFGGLSNRK